MTVFFHAASVGFYIEEIHGPRTISIPDPDWQATDDPEVSPPLIEIPNPGCSLPPPDELVAVEEADYLALLDAQGQGQLIEAGPEGRPVAVNPPPASAAELERRERLWRDSTLVATDAQVVRHRDEIEAEHATTLTAAQYRELQAYRSALRNWPEASSFPAVEERPAPPVWLVGSAS